MHAGKVFGVHNGWQDVGFGQNLVKGMVDFFENKTGFVVTAGELEFVLEPREVLVVIAAF